MKIALLGYGKMGKEIEKLCEGTDMEIVARIDNEADWQTYDQAFRSADVAIEFSTPDTVIPNIRRCFEAGVPVVVGTTGWYDRMEEIKSACREKDGALVFGSNFSVGVNLFFKMNELFAKIMNDYPDYKVAMEEIHHTQKLDAPSGTAISLANILIKEIDRMKSWQKGESNQPGTLGIVSRRIDPTPGTHIISYLSDIDEI
jgi:4-hydroxy-tetrahydrodipicolinate reductase